MSIMYPSYIYIVRDPRDNEKVVWVGTSFKPWEAIQRHLLGSSSDAMIEWSKGLSEDFPEGVELLGQVVLDRWLGEKVEFPPERLGITRLHWEIIDEELPPNHYTDPLESRSQIVARERRLMTWIRHYQALGHPLLNGRRGRPTNIEKASAVKVDEVD